MCGIAGFLAADPSSTPRAEHRAAVKRMTDALVHRGPDAEGVWQHGPCTLGHRRLSIIDLSPEGTQPMWNEDGTVAVVVNGEFYDFQPLRDELIAKGHTMRSKSDSEVLLHLYEEVGARCVERLHGMFAFALYDTRARTLLLGRDRAGKKPLFYRRTREGLAFASEVHALITAFPDERPEVDLGAIDEYLTLQYVPSPRSAYRDVYKLPPATVATVSPGALPSPERYWSKPDAPEFTDSPDVLAKRLREIMTEAVRRRMVADVPLGAFLSGGIDSSTVVALMAGLSKRPVKTFTIGFPDADDSEVRFARMVANRYRTEHHEMTVSPTMTSVVHDIVRHHGEPFADSSSVATWYLAKMTREHVTVSLSGDASDENFAGYKRYNPARLGHLHDTLPPAAQRALRVGLSAVGHAVYPYLGRFADKLDVGEAARYLLLVGQFSPEDKTALYGDALRGISRTQTRDRFQRVLDESHGRSALQRLLDLDFRTYLADDINPKIDIAAMAHALEVRCPFLDTEVVEFAARLPTSVQMRARGKWLVRKAFEDLLPWQILYRTKRGFALPLERWMKRDLGDMTRDMLLDARARARGIFDPREVQRLCDDFFVRGRGSADKLWTLLMLETWFRAFIDA